MNLENLKFVFLKNLSGIKPLLVLALLVGPYYAYLKTERVWDNLGYINNEFQSDFDSVFSETTTHLKLDDDERTSIREKTESWPISLLSKLVLDTLTNSGVIVHSDSTEVKYRYSDQLIFNKETDRFTRQFRIAVQDSLLPQVVTMIKQEIDSIKTVNRDDYVVLEIIAWTSTDEAIVKFKDPLDP